MEKVGKLSEQFNDSSSYQSLRPGYCPREFDSRTYQQIQNPSNNLTCSTGLIINRLYLYPRAVNACRYKDVTFIYADVCPVCLEIYSIPVYLDNGISNDELAIKIDEVQKRKCRRDKLDEITNLTKNQKSVFYKELRTELPFCMLKEVQNWTNNEPYLRSISVLNDPRLCCTHLTSAIQSKEDTFIM